MADMKIVPNAGAKPVPASKAQELRKAIAELGGSAPETANEEALEKLLSDLGQKQMQLAPPRTFDGGQKPDASAAQAKPGDSKNSRVIALIDEHVQVGKDFGILLKKGQKYNIPAVKAQLLIESKAVASLD